MSQLETSIQPPPPDSGISLEVRGNTYLVSGQSEGIPLELFSSEELEAVEKALRLKAKLTPSASETEAGDLLAQQNFDWSIEISDGHVTLSTGAPKDDDHFHQRELKRIHRSPEGYHLAELSVPGGNEGRNQILTGTLEASGDEWLQKTLILLLDLDQNGFSKPQEQNEFNFDPPESFQIVEHPGNSRTEIQYRIKALHRLLPLVIGAIVLSLAGGALLSGGGGGEGLLPDLVKALGDHPLWSKVLKAVIIAGFAYLTFRVALMVLGTLKMTADAHSFEIKKGILGIGFPVSMSRSKMKGLEQLNWIHRHRDADGHSVPTQYWRLALLGDKSITLLADETTPKNIEWLAQYLSTKYDLPIEKRTLPTKG